MSSIQNRIALKKHNDVEEYRRNAPEVLDLEGAAKYLNVAPRTLSEHAEALGIPYRELGRKLLFSRDRLIEWVRDGGKRY